MPALPIAVEGLTLTGAGSTSITILPSSDLSNIVECGGKKAYHSIDVRVAAGNGTATGTIDASSVEVKSGSPSSKGFVRLNDSVLVNIPQSPSGNIPVMVIVTNAGQMETKAL